MNHLDDPLPDDLLQAPTGTFPPPPVETAAQLLPFGQLPWEDFERLCLRVARLEGTPTNARRYGTAGQSQSGIDLFGALPGGRYATYQCKRYETLEPAHVRAAVDKFVKGNWAARSDRFVLCTSFAAARTPLADAIETQRKRLAKRRRPITLDVWDGEELSLLLKSNPEVVRDFFGPHWTARFTGAGHDPGPLVEDMFKQLLARADGNVEYYVSDWASIHLSDRLRTLHTADPTTFARFAGLVGNPPDPESLSRTVAEPPVWLRDASAEVWELLAWTAESIGCWAGACVAWETAAQRAVDNDYFVTGALVSAAVAAKVAGNAKSHGNLISRASARDPRHPRLVLALIPHDSSAVEQLALIEGLTTDDPIDRAHLAAQHALAFLLTPDVDSARAAIAEVAESLPGSIIVRGLEVSLRVQEGRLATMSHSALDRAALVDAIAIAQDLRAELAERGRFLEATRLVMLEADAHALLGDRRSASRVLGQATDEERATTEQKIVLASSAIERALDYALGLTLLTDADESDPAVQRLRLEALEQTGSPSERQAAIEGLETIVADGGEGAAEAAFARLAATIGSRSVDWSDDAAVLLRHSGHERVAVIVEATYAAKTEGFAAAERVLNPYGRASWAATTRMRLAMTPVAPRSAAASAADEVLSFGPSHALQVEAGMAFARSGSFVRARQVLASVARDPGAPDAARKDAYEKLMYVVGRDQDDWAAAGVFYDQWVRLLPIDNRAAQWGPMIANRR